MNKDLDVIKLLRFPLIVGVVCNHSKILSYGFSESFLGKLQYLLSDIVCHPSTIFFIFSGYLFFRNIDQLTPQTYIQKIKNRIKTLLIPYLIWDLLYLLFIWGIQVVLGMTSTANHKVIADYSFTEGLSLFWNGYYNGKPINFPLWFIRDLMIVVLFSPILYYVLWAEKKYLKSFSLLLIGLGMLFVLGLTDETKTIPSYSALFFFTLGAYYAMNKKSFIPSSSWGYALTIIYLGLVLLQMFLFGAEWMPYVYRTCKIFGSFTIIYWASKLCNKQPNQRIWDSNFFVYVSHMFVLASIREVSKQILPLEIEWLALCYYFGSITLVVTICVMLNLCLQKYAPKTTAILLGGR